MITFGPIPSRRLGNSLGVTNIPPKVCSYSCIYCQLGRTGRMGIDRRFFYKPEEIKKAVTSRLEKAGEKGVSIDFLTFVSDGEPTLDRNLGATIRLLKPFGIKIAVITKGSLMGHSGVQDALGFADRVSLKVDSVNHEIWRKINRPHRQISLYELLRGMEVFAKNFRGVLATETMLVKGVNDQNNNLEETGMFLSDISPDIAYLSIPTRPPAEKWVEPPGERSILRSHQILSRFIDKVEYLIGYEGNAFASPGNIEEDLLNITSVHPMRKMAVRALLNRAGVGWDIIENLVREKKLTEITYQNNTFYIRNISRPNKH